MWMMKLAATVIAALSAMPGAAAQGPRDEPARGAIEWFEGTYQAALDRAAAEERLVFIDFWTDWCRWCDRLHAETYAADSVVAELQDVVCITVDAESESGAALARRFGVRKYPTLLVVNGSGEPEDKLGGFLHAPTLVAELRRVKRGEWTIGALRKAVTADGTDLGARWALAKKLRAVGDDAGYDREVAAIHLADPEGRSTPMRAMALARLLKETFGAFKRTREFDARELRALLAGAKDGEFLYEGWSTLAYYQAVSDRREAARSSYRLAWPHCPVTKIADFGNQIAWLYWESASELSTEEQVWALAVARKAAQAAGDDAAVLDTLACCLYMNGLQSEALCTVRRCIELDPDMAEWRERLQAFEH
ncbi:MAG: DUF255 domain-containing protein [Planctomycetota bacterium]|nr:MAG: DUF255 domain-containing protein [Planctomycetota bacterium]